MEIMEKIRKIIEHLFRLVIGGIFLVAAILKIMNPQLFQQEILAYQMVGYPLSFLMAHVLPFLELMIGIGLVFRISYRIGLMLALGSLILFSVALAWTWMQGLNIDCGCFGKIDLIHGQPMALLRDLALIAMLLYLYRRDIVKVSTG